jgi:hypothetical protein
MVRENFVTGARDLAALSAVTTFARPPSARGRYSADRTLPAIARTSLNEKLANMRGPQQTRGLRFSGAHSTCHHEVAACRETPLLNPVWLGSSFVTHAAIFRRLGGAIAARPKPFDFLTQF